MVGLEALHLPARDAVVRFADAPNALALVSRGTLAALKELRLPLGRFIASSIEEAVRQARAVRRAWELGTLKALCFSDGPVASGGLRGAPHAQPLVLQAIDGLLTAGCLRDVAHAQARILILPWSDGRVGWRAVLRCTRSSSHPAME